MSDAPPRIGLISDGLGRWALATNEESDAAVHYVRADAGELGRVAYEAYRKQSGGRSLVSGASIPEWNALPIPIQRAWNAAALAVGRTVLAAVVDLPHDA